MTKIEALKEENKQLREAIAAELRYTNGDYICHELQTAIDRYKIRPYTTIAYYKNLVDSVALAEVKLCDWASHADQLQPGQFVRVNRSGSSLDPFKFARVLEVKHRDHKIVVNIEIV